MFTSVPGTPDKVTEGTKGALIQMELFKNGRKSQ